MLLYAARCHSTGGSCLQSPAQSVSSEAFQTLCPARQYTQIIWVVRFGNEEGEGACWEISLPQFNSILSSAEWSRQKRLEQLANNNWGVWQYLVGTGHYKGTQSTRKGWNTGCSSSSNWKQSPANIQQLRDAWRTLLLIPRWFISWRAIGCYT